MRIEVFYKNACDDGRAKKLCGELQKWVSSKIEAVAVSDIYLTDFEGLTLKQARSAFSDRVAQNVAIDASAAESDFFPGWSYAVEVTYKAGVANPIALTARKAIETVTGTLLSRETTVQSALGYWIRSGELSSEELDKLQRYLHNGLIERATLLTAADYGSGKRFPQLYPHTVAASPAEVAHIDIESLSDSGLTELSRKRLLALSLEEMKAVKAYYLRSDIREKRNSAGLPPQPTDVELEMIAQTWSEHCKHKILNANISYKEEGKTEEINSLFKQYIKKTTDLLAPNKPFLRSVFVDDSGIVEFDDDHCVCFKVETHNSPSALDPYGGAITGIVGVNRDIMGSGKSAHPIFNTNVLCFGDPNTKDEEIPEGLLHPRRVMSGVHRGIIDGGNQSGIPVVGGAFIFDDSYIGKPLVFCGTGGILPAQINGEGAWIKHIMPGAKAVMIGGRIGKDGIHGATFSSLVLDEESPTSAVQIGDPITQKKFNDFLAEARDKSLFCGITDNGAGGLSSSLGEMAEFSGGIRVDLDKCPLKYAGLAPWEIWVSESQERMSLAVADETLEEFLALAKKRDVEATVIGEFTDSGFIELFYNKKPVCALELAFIHDGLPKMNLQAEWIAPQREKEHFDEKDSYNDDLARLLADASIASKEPLVRQYDHEVQAQSVIKPFIGEESDGPSDGAVLRPVADSNRGLTVTHGICQRYSDLDTYQMAACAVDEAFRAHIALGGNPEKASALDNFCWPDPVESAATPDGKYKAAQLVRCCKGLQDTCLAYGLPLISGKDSMKNDANLGGKKVSVRPTLLVSLMGITDDVRRSQTTDFKKPGDKVYLVGATRGEMGATSFEKIQNAAYCVVPSVDTQTALPLYKRMAAAIQNRTVASCHDLADGGLAVAVAESALAGRIGCSLNLDTVKEARDFETARLLFCETPSRFLVTVEAQKTAEFEKTMQDSVFACLGETTATDSVEMRRGGKTVLNMKLSEIEEAWKKTFAAVGKQRSNG